MAGTLAIEEENNDETNALIAKLLAEDNPYAQDLDQGISDNDSDYDRKPKRRKFKAAAKRSAKAAAKAAISKAVDQDCCYDAEELSAVVANGRAAAEAEAPVTASGRKRRKDVGTQRREGRGWSNEEERLFLEALEQHGRDWSACAQHIGTRDAKSVTSHAQKHLIRLCIEGKLLPSKMAESGVGYTLSGKLLDPTSAAARSYGLKPAVVERLRTEKAASLTGMLPLEPPGEDGGPRPVLLLPEPPKQPKPVAKPRTKASSKQQTAEAEPDPLRFVKRTEYALSRPRREVAGANNSLGGTTESLELVRCRDFVGPPGSGAPLAQPFSLEVLPQAMVVMDFHAHLSSVEIIGLLGGEWHAKKRTLVVTEAFPCRSAMGSESGISVELDPEHEVETRALMHERGLVSVGWYHSHPVFETRPSQKDCENQRNYQALFRVENSSDEPFVAAIVGPYDPQLPSLTSSVSWFVVRSRSGELTPFNLRYTSSSKPVPLPATRSKLNELLTATSSDPGRVDLSEQWRPFTRLAGGKPEGSAVTRLDKLRGALQAHLGDSVESAAWLDQLTADIQGTCQ